MTILCLCNRLFQADKVGHFGYCPHCNQPVLVRTMDKRLAVVRLTEADVTKINETHKMRRFER